MSPPDTIIITPIGKIPPWISTTIARSMKKIFGMNTRVVPLLEDIHFAFDKKRRQYYSTLILDQLSCKTPKDCVKLLAVTREDLFIPILTHVYGEAQLGGSASIISISRLLTYPYSGSLKQGHDRIIKEAAHELGHTFDLRHCEDPSCIMHYCRKIEDVDQKSDTFCRYCRVLLSDNLKLFAQ